MNNFIRLTTVEFASDSCQTNRFMYKLELIVIHIINRDMQELFIPIRLIPNHTGMN